MKSHRLPHPSWLVLDGRAARPELWLAAAGFLVLLLAQVWQNSHMAELNLHLDRSRSELQRAHARLDFLRAEFERRTTRSELQPMALALGLVPADAQQVVRLPSEYLADGEPALQTTPQSTSVLAWAERASRVLVPDARAKSRSEN